MTITCFKAYDIRGKLVEQLVGAWLIELAALLPNICMLKRPS
ncbi:hypothetical protein C427_1039 [Paraglaciecola psychrophila 170]|uniref:Uncharacterized protein n=1 Tax=Paraglaciecola psychrophila 170 TaxID=1129794 RepID=K7ADX3_9ALTE|nr:hypothetical protein C427_1039 [Paraglaciecola psychrophila 170]GAC38828.1 hypothetical protein GPSY_3217 [Paraglaciecola psychrophila 170]